jgi:hypothetical protein
LPLRQMYDTGEIWSAALRKSELQARLIPLVVTAAHEIGHALGLGHSNDPNALMYPSLNVQAWGPQSWDVREARARYGEPRPKPTPPPPSDPADPGELVLRFKVFPNSKEFQVIPPEGWKQRGT